ncbi:glycosyltransferase [Nocardioides abyssi]|uniref:Glycosyltransferase n=1 Tax=Nocardioides abyssi TaxID=3058370 RepID=A0ABT8EW19_9ACTN|nr:glycosyltransferase [Nocardioides abyssi]MDN4162372.1 glycosyltransferase [Nocardioides abyssi]
MRITLVTETCQPAGEPTLKATTDRLVDLGHDVRLVAPAPGMADYRRCRVDRVTPLDRRGAQVRAAIDAHRPDVVHVTDPGPLGRRALVHARRHGIPSLVVQQQAVLAGTLDRWRLRVGARADRVVVTARWHADRLAEAGVPAETWQPGVDTAAFTPALRDPWLHDRWARARSAEGPLVVVGYVGALTKHEGVRRLATLARVPGTRTVLIGEGPQRDWLADRLPGSVTTGRLGPGDLAVALASLDVLVHPGEEQTCCHALRAAGASGVPVVAPRSGGARELVRPLETGLLAPAGDPLGLARAAGVVAGDRHRAMMGRRARELAMGRSWPDAVDELVERHLAPLATRRTPSTAGR